MKRAISVPCWAVLVIFVAGSASAQAPDQIVLELPADAATDVSITPTLEWFKDDLADTYSLEVAIDAGFGGAIVHSQSDITDTTYTLPALLNDTTYYWHVWGVNGSGDGPTSADWSFTTIVAAPATPSLTSPDDAATGVSTTPTLEWGAVGGADTYTVELDTDPDFGSVDQTQTSGATSFSPSALSKGTEYNWRVKASNVGGDSGWASRSFTTEYDPPGAPDLTAPADAAVDVDLQPTFDWNDASGTVSSYRIDVSDDGFSTFVISDSTIDGGTTEYVPSSPLATSTTYSWRVRAKNPDDVVGPFSSTRTFTTVPPPPSAPTLISPADDSTGVPTSVTLTWDLVGDADTYTAQISADPDFDPLVDEQTSASTSFSPSGLANGTEYHWRVSANNAGGSSGYSMRSFTTVYNPPGKPTLTSPADDDEDVVLTPTFMWTPGSGTSFFYRIDVSTQNNFNTLVLSDTTVSASYTPSFPLDPDQQYHWRVRGDNDGGPGDFSSKFKFTTVPPAPGQVTLTSPADDAVEVSLTPNLNWENESGADTYTVQVSTVANFSSTVVDESDLASSNYTLPAPLASGSEYFWRARAENAGGLGPYSAVWSFTTVTSKQVVLSSPSNGATSIDLSPTLSWNSVVGATSYDVQVSKSANMSNPVVDQSVGTTSLGVGPLDPSTIYHWRVRADNADPSLWSETWSFVTGTGTPGVVMLVSPADDATGISTTPTFKWRTQASADDYRFDLSTSDAFGSFVATQSGITDTTFAPGVALDNGTEYFWRVLASNGVGDGPYSSVYSFTTTEAAPGAPTLSSPANGALAVSITPTFIWEAVAKGLAKTSTGSTGADTYDLDVATDGNFNSKVVSVTDLGNTNYDEAVLSHGVQYFWRVRGVNEAGPGPWSATFNFVTIAGGDEQVTLISPANGATDVDLSPTLSWDEVSGAATYQLQISKVPNFTTLVLNIASVGGTEFQATDLDGLTLHYWRVRATNSGAQNWSETWSFTTASGTPDMVTLVSPIDGATNVAIDLTLSWNQALKADAYDLQVATENTFADPVVDMSGIAGTSMAMSALIHGQVYYWRVRGTNSVTDGEWSAVRGFITVRGGPTQVQLISPEGGSTGIPLETELLWHSVDGAATYHIQVATTFSFNLNDIILEITQHPDTVLQLLDLGPDSTYAWRVKASTAGVNNWSITASFSTGKGVPGQVVLESPLNNATEIDLEPELIWTVPTRATSFNLQVALDTNFTTVLVSETELTDVMFTLPELDPVTDYFWRVQAGNQDGVGDWSETRKFTTIGVEAPAAPVLISPLNGASEVSFKPLFSWNAAAGATSYKLEVATNPSFSTVTVAVVVAQPFFQSAALALGELYYWRVEARNAGGSTLSEVWSFTTVLTTDAEEDEIPEDFALSQNYPNPFNPSTAIEFAMPKGGQATLVVYNVRGEEIARLVDGFMAAGRHTVRWEAGAVPSGVYLYRFEADDFSEVRKLILAK